jgi:hypothetical protein
MPAPSSSASSTSIRPTQRLADRRPAPEAIGLYGTQEAGTVWERHDARGGTANMAATGARAVRASVAK